MRLRTIAALFAVLAGLLAACGRESGPLTVTARDYGFTGVPQTIGGGAVDITFTNAGKADHELVFLDVGETNPNTVASQLGRIFEGKPFPANWKRVTGAGVVEPGQTLRSTVSLPKGEWMLMCALDDAPGDGEKTLDEMHMQLGMYENVTVEGPEDVDVDEPAGGTFTAKDHAFAPPSDIARGEREYRFVNDGPTEWHFMEVLRFPQGTTPAQAESSFGKLVTAPEDAPPPAGVKLPDEEGGFASGVLSPGMAQTFTFDFEAGRTYLLACFVSDKAGGPPHAIGPQKMYKAFQVPA